MTALLKLIDVVGAFGLDGILAQSKDNTEEKVLGPYELSD
jgi:hypothetical protein